MDERWMGLGMGMGMGMEMWSASGVFPCESASSTRISIQMSIALTPIFICFDSVSYLLS